MSSYYSPNKGVVNRYWKRPKPRVYECNVRDAERFYQQSYKDYLEAKEYASRRASEDRTRISDDSPSRWSIRRTNSGTDSVSRDTSGYENASKTSYLNSSSSSKQYGDDSLSSVFRSSSVTGSKNRSSESDITTIEDRLQRLQKLRAELGLPSSEISTGTSKVTFSAPSPTNSTLNLSKKHLSPDPRERRGRTVDVSSTSYSSARGSSRSRASDLESDSYDDKHSVGKEKSIRFAKRVTYDDSIDTPKQNGYSSSSYSSHKDEPDKYSYKSSQKSDKKYESRDNAYSYKPSESNDSGETKSFRSSRKPPAIEINDDDDLDADAYLTSIRKKFPTSDEILERIRKMDSDM